MAAPPCPPPVKVAAILLIVVGIQSLLVSAGAAVVIVAVTIVNTGAACPYLIVALPPLSIGWAFVRIAVTTLRGTTANVRNNVAVCMTLGGLGSILGLFAVLAGIRDGAASRPPGLTVSSVVFAGNVLVLLNSVAALVAGSLLVGTRGRYETWRLAKAIHATMSPDD
jgi:hypothetical protein